MKFPEKVIFYFKLLITYVFLKIKIKVSRHNIWRLDFYVFSLRNNLKIISESRDFFHVEYKLNQNRRFLIRHYPSSDFSVFKSVIIEKQYDLNYNFTKKQYEEMNIIDAGANVGYTAIYFKDKFPKAKIICIEPSKENFVMLKNNLENNFFDNIYVEMSAVWYKVDKLFLDNKFRDHREHSIRTVESSENNQESISSVTLDIIAEINNFDEIDILKIDIEGAEAEIFQKDQDLDNILLKTKYVAIEIHDEFNCRSDINKKLINNKFNLEILGELTFASKNNL